MDVGLTVLAPWWAWRLYANPDRTVDLAPGDDVRQASFVPLSFFALPPAFAMPDGLPVARPIFDLRPPTKKIKNRRRLRRPRV
jgi:hypothetical protein